MTNNENETSAAKKKPSGQRGWFGVNHFSIWFVCVLFVYLSNQLDRLLGLSFFLIPVLAIPALVAGGTTLAGLVENIWTRRWKKLISVVAAPTITIGLFVAAVHNGIDPDWFRFQFTRAYYTYQARHLPGPSPKYHEWYWGETGGVGVANIFYRLVYDETDKPLDTPAEQHYDGAQALVRPYGQHFFLVTEIYQ
nr:hypothetical protein HUO10_006343 [Paraburkholderia busanensis]